MGDHQKLGRCGTDSLMAPTSASFLGQECSLGVMPFWAQRNGEPGAESPFCHWRNHRPWLSVGGLGWRDPVAQAPALKPWLLLLGQPLMCPREAGHV